MKIALKVTPQRSTQYANMAEILAAPELLASPLGNAITTINPATLAGQGYLIATLDCASDPYSTRISIMPILSRLGATSEVFEYFDSLGEVEGPLLRPLDPHFTPFVPLEMAEIRRYKGKTNEVFTRVLQPRSFWRWPEATMRLVLSLNDRMLTQARFLSGSICRASISPSKSWMNAAAARDGATCSRLGARGQRACLCWHMAIPARPICTCKKFPAAHVFTPLSAICPMVFSISPRLQGCCKKLCLSGSSCYCLGERWHWPGMLLVLNARI